jgi:hypothetical protein
MTEFMYCWTVQSQDFGTQECIHQILDVLYASYPHSFDLDLVLQLDFVEKSGKENSQRILNFHFNQDISREDIKNFLKVGGFAPFNYHFKGTVIKKVILIGPPSAI